MKDKLTFKINPFIHGKTALITGAGGTIGSALVEAMINQGVEVIAIDISEYAMYRLNQRFNVESIVGDVSDERFVNMVFDTYVIDYIFHCAAYKHVDMMEEELQYYSIFKNNIGSTANLLEHPVERFVFISSDKAVKPNNNVGHMKQLSEQMVRDHCKGIYKIVRFGNVYNSSGSFIETMNRQIEEGVPVTITHEEMKRFFLTLNDAVSLINEVAYMDDDSGTYLLNMGEEVKIQDLVPEGYQIEYIGIRPGEKLSEDLLEHDEDITDTTNDLIKCITTTTTS